MIKGTEAVAVPAHEGSSLQATLLISLLLRFPEIGSVRFLPEDGRIAFTFLLRQAKGHVCLAAFERSVHAHLDAFSRVNGGRTGFVSVEFKTYGELSIVEVVREVASFSRHELSLLISLIRDCFGEALVVETVESLRVDEQIAEEELIDDILEDVRVSGPWRELMGFRDAGRVLVFNKNRHKVRE